MVELVDSFLPGIHAELLFWMPITARTTELRSIIRWVLYQHFLDYFKKETRHLGFILACFIETGDSCFLSSSAQHTFHFSHRLYSVFQTSYLENVLTLTTDVYPVSIQQIKIPLRAERTYQVGTGGDRKHSLKRLILRMHMMHFIVWVMFLTTCFKKLTLR